MEQTLNTAIKSVSVFQSQARIRREGRVILSEGSHQLVIADLPPRINPDSLRVSGFGEGITLKDFELRKAYLIDYQEESITSERSLLEEAEKQKAALDDRKALIEQAKLSLNNLSIEGMGSFARALAYEKTSLDELRTLREYLDESLMALLTSGHEIDREIAMIKREIDAHQKKLADLLAARHKTRLEAVVSVEAAREADLLLVIEYHVDDAHWAPHYELRLEDEKLSLTYLATVTQFSGEDWLDIDLILSTASPAITTEIPELSPWYIDLYREMPMMAMKSSANLTMREAGAPAPMMEADVAEAVVETEGIATRYVIPYPVDVISNRQPHKITVGSAILSPEIAFLSFPSLTEQVFVKATAPNDSPFTLLPGPTAIFNEGHYMGKGALPLIVPGEKVEAMMGIEDRIRVEKERTKREVVKSRIGTMRKESHTYQIKITNLRDEKTDLEVVDQIPVSLNADLKVEMISALPQPQQTNDLNIVKWKLLLIPTQTAAITYSFSVEFPKEGQVTGIY